MSLARLLTRRKPPAHQHTSTTTGEPATAVLAASADAEIRMADAEVDRSVKARAAEIELAEKARLAAEAAADREAARKRRNALVKTRTRQRKQAAKRRARAQWWAGRKARFQNALAGRLVLLLCGQAMATAWYGQVTYLHAEKPSGLGLPLPVAATAATAAEVFGFALFAIARAAGEYRDRALRARLLGWLVIAFSAWSNYSHHGVALAVMSVVGPLAWEIHEWWKQRAKLYAEGKMARRPVRPRFPIDQAILFPLWTLRAYRVAVRDRIESTELALEIARRESIEHRPFRRSNRRRWARSVRESIESGNRALVDRARTELEVARSIKAEGEALLAAGAMLLGPDRVHEVADSIESTRSTGDQGRSTPRRWLRFGRAAKPIESGASIDARSAASIEARPDGSIESPADSIEGTGAKSIDGRSGAGSIESARSIERVESIDVRSGAESIESARSIEARPGGSIESPADSIEGTGAKSIDGRSGAGSIESPRPTGKRERASRADRPTARGKSIEQLHREGIEVAERRGWRTAQDVVVEHLRIELKCGPKRARAVADWLAKHLTGTANTDTAGSAGTAAADQAAA